MKIITIKSLRLENFKCHRFLNLNLDGRNASIYGDNATGKSSCYDALTWLLFGKDSHGNGDKVAEIKPLNAAGEVADHDAITTVEAVLVVDGVEIALRREYREQWTTKRGSAVPTYDGNVSDYFVDGVPTKAGAFKAAISQIVDEDTFRMLTNVYFFAGELPWQKRREILGQVAQLPEDRQILETDGRFFPLISGMGSLDLGGYKSKLLAERKGLVGARNEIPARIDECQKVIADLSSVDFDEIRRGMEILEHNRDALRLDLNAVEHSSAMENLDLRLRDAKFQMQQLESSNARFRGEQEADKKSQMQQLEAENKQFRAEQEAKQPDTWRLRDQLRRAEVDLANERARLPELAEKKKRWEERVDLCREDWKRIDAEVFDGDDTCPTCGQKLPAAKMAMAKAVWQENKNNRLQETVNRASDYKGMVSDMDQQSLSCKQRITDLENLVSGFRGKLEAAESQRVTVVDMDGYQDRKAEIQNVTIHDMVDYAEKMDALQRITQEIQDQIFQLKTDSEGRAGELRRKISEAEQSIRDLSAELAKESVLKYTRERVEKLRTDAKEATDRLADVEQMLFLIDDYTRYGAAPRHECRTAGKPADQVRH